MRGRSRRPEKERQYSKHPKQIRKSKREIISALRGGNRFKYSPRVLPSGECNVRHPGLPFAFVISLGIISRISFPVSFTLSLSLSRWRFTLSFVLSFSSKPLLFPIKAPPPPHTHTRAHTFHLFPAVAGFPPITGEALSQALSTSASRHLSREKRIGGDAECRDISVALWESTLPLRSC